MTDPTTDPLTDPTEELIETFLEGAPRAETWGALRHALELRLEAAQSEKEIQTLHQQIAALAQEEAITHFVEDSIRVTAVRPRGGEFAFDDDEFED